MKYIIIILGIFSNALASSLIKYATTYPRSFHTPMEVIKNWYLLLGIIFYGLAFVLYVLALEKFPLNVAHPILTSGAIALVSIFSIVFFNEPFTYKTFIGFFLIIGGVFFLTIK